jgi:AbiJ N-terminal domain 3
MDISKEARRTILDYLITRGEASLSGQLDLVDFLGRTRDLSSMPSTDARFKTAAGDICKHMVMNDDWSLHYLLYSYLDLGDCDDEQFIRFLENCVHPTVLSERERVEELVSYFNETLRGDGYVLQIVSQLCGKPVYKVVQSDKGGVNGTVKNLIFAADRFKPEIILQDAINNDIEIVRNQQYCLVYNRPLLERGLLWKDLVAWWREQPGNERLDKTALENRLYDRLILSVTKSAPERLLFRTYMHHFPRELGDALPALVPQVYLHYDPYTIKQLAGGKPRLMRQRMDFLLLFSNQVRVVIEVDGQQHYAEKNGNASPRLYAEMVAEDRRLRLAGYEIYRFGGYELQAPHGPPIVIEFFRALFQRHLVYPAENRESEELFDPF